MAIVIGPTPPGTGVIAGGMLGRTDIIDVADEFRLRLASRVQAFARECG